MNAVIDVDQFVYPRIDRFVQLSPYDNERPSFWCSNSVQKEDFMMADRQQSYLAVRRTTSLTSQGLGLGLRAFCCSQRVRYAQFYCKNMHTVASVNAIRQNNRNLSV